MNKIHGMDCAVRGPTFKCDCGIDDDFLATIKRDGLAIRELKRQRNMAYEKLGWIHDPKCIELPK